MKFPNHIFLIVGQSGAGKDTVVNKLCRYYHATQLKSYTTRPKRYDKEDCHTFIESTKDDFSDVKEQYPHRVAETIFDNHFYFATQEQVDESDFYIIDLDGVKTFKDKYKGNKKVVIVYLELPPLIEIIRLLKRGDSEDAIKQRVYHDIEAFADASEYCDYKINAGKSKRYTFNKLRHIIEKEIK